MIQEPAVLVRPDLGVPGLQQPPSMPDTGEPRPPVDSPEPGTQQPPTMPDAGEGERPDAGASVPVSGGMDLGFCGTVTVPKLVVTRSDAHECKGALPKRIEVQPLAQGRGAMEDRPSYRAVMSDASGNLATNMTTWLGSRSTYLRYAASPQASWDVPYGHAHGVLSEGFALQGRPGNDWVGVALPDGQGGWSVSGRGLPKRSVQRLLAMPGALPVLIGVDPQRPGILWLERMALDGTAVAREEWAGDAVVAAGMDVSGAALVLWSDASGTHGRWFSARDTWAGEVFTPPPGSRLEPLLGGGLLLERAVALYPDGTTREDAAPWARDTKGAWTLLKGRWYALEDQGTVTVYASNGTWCGSVTAEPVLPFPNLTVTFDGTVEGPISRCPNVSWSYVLWLWPHALSRCGEDS